MVTLTINGASHTLEHAVSVAELLQRMDLAGKRVAVERNGDIVPRSQFGEVQVNAGDKLEIVVAVGGG